MVCWWLWTSKVFLVTFSVSLDVCGLPVAGSPLTPKNSLESASPVSGQEKDCKQLAGSSNLGWKVTHVINKCWQPDKART